MNRPAKRNGERGSVLILAVLILFSMLALGLVGMRSATQNISGSGNLKLSKQARFVAESGLYHAMTLLNREGGNLLPLRASSALELSQIVVESTDSELGLGRSSRVVIQDAQGLELTPLTRPAPPIFDEGPAPLGEVSGRVGLQPSYRVKVSGFQPWGCPPGFDEAALAEQGEGCCLMHFEAVGYVAPERLPTVDQFDSEDGRSRYAEHTLRAGVVLGPFSLIGCQP